MEAAEKSGHYLVKTMSTKLMCSKCLEKCPSKKAWKWLNENKCKGWRLNRDAKVCYVADPNKVAARYQPQEVKSSVVEVIAVKARTNLDDSDSDWLDQVDDQEEQQEQQPWAQPPRSVQREEEPPEEECCEEEQPKEEGEEEGNGKKGKRKTISQCNSSDFKEIIDENFDAADGQSKVFCAESLRTAEATEVDRRHHKSHRYGEHCGTLWCWACGGWTQGDRTVKLTRACVPPTAAGEAALRRLRQAKPPTKGGWAFEAEAKRARKEGAPGSSTDGASPVSTLRDSWAEEAANAAKRGRGEEAKGSAKRPRKGKD